MKNRTFPFLAWLLILIVLFALFSPSNQAMAADSANTPTPIATGIYTPGPTETAENSPAPTGTLAAADTSTPMSTPTVTPTIPAGEWLVFADNTYRFQFMYPPDGQLVPGANDSSTRINLPFVQGTNLREKYLQMTLVENANPCRSPLAASSFAETSEVVAFDGITFLKETGKDAAAGNFYKWTAYSTMKDNACASLDFTLHALNPENLIPPPPLFDEAAESLVFGQIVSTFQWLNGSSTTTPTPTAAPGSCIVPPAGLLSWWPGDGNADDIVGSRNGTLVGGVTFTAGKVGQAFNFDGIDDIVLAPATGFPTGAASRTVAFWSKIGPFVGHSTGFAYGTEEIGKGFYVFPSHYRTGGKLAFSGHGAEYDVLAPTDLRDDLYHHVVVTYDGAIITIYADGVIVASGSLNLDTGISGGASIGGRGYMGEFLAGEVDEVALWNRVLSASEIQALFDAGSAGMCKNLTAPPSQTAKLFAVSVQGGASTNEIYRYAISPTGSSILERVITDPSFDAPWGVEFSANGELFVTNRSQSHQSGSISRILNPTGNPQWNGTITASNFFGPHVSKFRNGELFVAQEGGSDVLRFAFDSGGNAQFNGVINSGLCCSAPRGVVIRPANGELFVTQCCGVSAINRYVFDASGNAIPNGVITGGGLSNPHDMAFSPWGELFVANAGNSTVSRFVFDASDAAQFNGQITGNRMNGSIGLDFSPWGELFVANHYAANVSRFIFDTAHNVTPNGFFSTPNTLGDIQFYPSPTIGNQPPTVDAGGPYSVNEGDFVTVTASGNDPDGGALTYAWDLDSNGSFETVGQSAIFSALGLDGPSSYTIKVRVNDIGGLSAADEATVSVSNVPPTINLVTNNGPINEGSSATIAANASDPAGGNDPLSYQFDCNNDSIYEIGPQSSNTISCSFGDNGNFPVNLRVSDGDTGTATDFTVVTVNNVPPLVAVPVVAPEPSIQGSVVTASATFNDPGLNDAPFTCTVNYGDGSGALIGSISGNTCTGLSHTYATIGSYPVTVRVTDKDHGIGSNSTTHAVIYKFTGFFQPVDNIPTMNVVKSGAGVAVKFSLNGNQGLNVMVAGYPVSQRIACDSGALLDDIEETVNTGSSSLSYDASSNTYIYTWKTDKAWAGTCRQLIVKLSDGTEHKANFKFK